MSQVKLRVEKLTGLVYAGTGGQRHVAIPGWQACQEGHGFDCQHQQGGSLTTQRTEASGRRRTPPSLP